MRACWAGEPFRVALSYDVGAVAKDSRFDRLIAHVGPNSQISTTPKTSLNVLRWSADCPVCAWMNPRHQIIDTRLSGRAT